VGMLRCPCGAVHTSIAGLVKVGWQTDGKGGACLLVNCTCQSTLVAEHRAEASFCAACHRLIEAHEIKSCSEAGVLRVGCAQRQPRVLVSSQRLRKGA
jgi:hypothetical protein